MCVCKDRLAAVWTLLGLADVVEHWLPLPRICPAGAIRTPLPSAVMLHLIFSFPGVFDFPLHS